MKHVSLAAAVTLLGILLTVGSKGAGRLETDLGEVWELNGIEVVGILRNPSRSVVKVHDVSTSCQCSSVHPREFEIEPGGSQELVARVDLGGGIPLGQEVSQFEITITPSTTPRRAVPDWRIHGTVRRYPLYPLRNGIEIDINPVRREYSLVVFPQLPIAGITATSGTPDVFLVDSASVHESECSINLRFRESLRVGAHNCRLKIFPQLPAGSKQPPPMNVEFVASICRGVVSQPSQLTLGFARPGEAVKSTFKLFSWVGAFRILDITTSPEDVILAEELLGDDDQTSRFVSVTAAAIPSDMLAGEVSVRVLEEETLTEYDIHLPVVAEGFNPIESKRE